MVIHYYLQPAIFAACVCTNGLHLPSVGVCILWEWEWIDFETMEMFGTPDGANVEENCDDEENIPSDPSDDTSSSQLSLSAASHTVTFKCIGATRSVDYQDALML